MSTIEPIGQTAQTHSPIKPVNQIQNRFTSINTNILREISLPQSVNNIIKINREKINKHEEEIIDVEKKLRLVRLQQMGTIHKKKILLKEFENDKDIDYDSYSELKINIKKLDKEELKLINQRFNLQKSITKLEEGIKTAIEEKPQTRKVQFNEIVHVHAETQEKKQYQQRTQSLDQYYTERTTSKRKLKVKPHIFIQKHIEKMVTTSTKLETIDYEKIRSTIEAKINQTEFAKNAIQKERFTSELDIQLSELKQRDDSSESSTDEEMPG